MVESHPSGRISVHQALGGGSVADLLLWRKLSSGILVLTSATVSWFIFERAGYNLLTFISNVLFLLLVILFFWAKSAALLNRPLPPLPNLEISEKTITTVADELRVCINFALAIARDIAIGRNLKLLLQVSVILWIISYIGSLFNFLTLVYIGVLLSMSLPLLYEKYQEPIDQKLSLVYRIVKTQITKVEARLLKKEKKTQ